MHDIDDIERRGIPAVMIASTPFEDAAQKQADALGLDVARVFVPHPIQDRTDEEKRELADLVFEKVLGTLIR